MIRSLRRLAILSLVLTGAPALATPTAGFEQRVDQLRTQYGVPGVTVAIVHGPIGPRS